MQFDLRDFLKSLAFILSFALMQCAPPDAFSQTKQFQQPNGVREENLKSKRAELASMTFDSALQAENFVRSRFCPGDEIISSKETLNIAVKRSNDRFFACRSMCSMHGCTYRVFLSNRNGKLRLAGLVDGNCEVQNDTDNGFRRIRCTSKSAEQRVEVMWRYDVHDYR
jgi:hypothetical protein